MLIGSGAGLAFPYFLGTLLDSSLKNQDFNALIVSISVLAGLELIAGLANYIKNINLGYISQHIISDLRDRLYSKLQRLSIGYYKNRNSGDIISKIKQFYESDILNYSLEQLNEEDGIILDVGANI